MTELWTIFETPDFLLDIEFNISDLLRFGKEKVAKTKSY